MGQAALMSFSRLKRTHAILTNKRLIIGQRVFFGVRHMITHMLYLDGNAAPADELNKLSAGLYSKGYQVWLTPRENFSAAMDSKKPYLKIIPDKTESTINIEHCRLYSDQPFTCVLGKYAAPLIRRRGYSPECAQRP